MSSPIEFEDYRIYVDEKGFATGVQFKKWPWCARAAFVVPVYLASITGIYVLVFITYWALLNINKSLYLMLRPEPNAQLFMERTSTLIERVHSDPLSLLIEQPPHSPMAGLIDILKYAADHVYIYLSLMALIIAAIIPIRHLIKSVRFNAESWCSRAVEGTPQVVITKGSVITEQLDKVCTELANPFLMAKTVITGGHIKMSIYNYMVASIYIYTANLFILVFTK